MTLYLVRHGRPVIDRDRPPAEWDLDPATFDDVWALRSSGRLPVAGAWFTSPEPKAVQTAQLLTESEVGIVDGLREHVREGGWVDEFAATVRRSFAAPHLPAHDGWEPLAACRDRVVGVVRALLAERPGDDLVLIGHGTAWTLVAAALTSTPPDLDRWQALAMPDLIVVETPPS